VFLFDSVVFLYSHVRIYVILRLRFLSSSGPCDLILPGKVAKSILPFNNHFLLFEMCDIGMSS